MSDMDEITKALAQKYSNGLGLDEKKKASAPSTSTTSTFSGYVSRTSEPTRTQSSTVDSSGGSKPPRIFPSEKMELRSWNNSNSVMPKRKPVLISDFSDEELKEMMNTPTRRSWEFSMWLEVIGLPPDLHDKHDFTIYGWVARAFLDRKREAHQR